MPTIKLSLFSTEETIDRPILTSVVEDIKNYLGYTNDVYTVYDEKDSIYRKKSIAGELKSPNTLPNESIVIDATEDIIDDYSRYLGYINPDTKPFYTDNDIDAGAKILYHKKKLNISFKYDSKSKSDVNALINRLRTNSVTEDYYITHNLEYSVILPIKYMKLLNHINTLKNNELKLGKTLADYISETFDSRATVIGSLDGNIYKDDVALRERQVSVIGYISDDISNIKKEYNENTNTWSVNFTYSVEYEKPTMFIVNYPLVVFNQLIDRDYRITMDSVPNRLTVRTPANEAIYNSIISIPRLNKLYNGQYVVFPSNDTETISPPTPNYVRVATAIALVEKDNLKKLFNLEDIRGFKFKDSFIEFIVCSELDYIGKPYQSMIYIEILKNGKPDYDNEVYIDKDLNLTTKLDLDPKSIYRVGVNILTDLSILSRDAVSRTTDYIKLENELFKESYSLVSQIVDTQTKLIDSLQLYSELTTNETTLLIKNIELLTLNHNIGDYDNKVKAYNNANTIVDNSTLPKDSRLVIKENIQTLSDLTQRASYSDRLLGVKFKVAVTKCKDINLGLTTTKQSDIIDKLVLIVNYSQYAMKISEDRDSVLKTLNDTNKDKVSKVYESIDAINIATVNNDEYNNKLVELLEPIKNSNIEDTIIVKISNSVKHEYSKHLIKIIVSDVRKTIIESVGNNAAKFKPVIDDIEELADTNPVALSDRDTLQDIYLNLFNVGHDDVSDIIKNGEDINRVIFNIELPSSIKFFTKEILINIPALIE